MSGFSASSVAFNVQKNFANKFFSNTSIVKGLIDETSAKLLDDLYNLIFAFVSDFIYMGSHPFWGMTLLSIDTFGYILL